MTSASSSSLQKSFKYDVFLSFRGEDTRKTFVDHLYHALHNKGIITYKDDERIEKGERISDQLIRSIEESRFYIIVFSKNYASSSWCLDELVQIMECQKKTEHVAYPIFYDVEPTEVRHQSGAVEEAFAKLVGKGKRKRTSEEENKDDAGRWRNALKDAAGLAGMELKTTFNGHEAKFIQQIVQDISLKLHFVTSSTYGKLVGMETRVKSVVSSLEIGSEVVRTIRIKGIGGGGKTTLVRAVFDLISVWFEGVSFIENVREVSKGSLSGLKELQKQMLSDALEDQSIVVTGVSDGKNKMKKMMPGRNALVVLDDVDDIDQLEALAGELTWFKPGSRIIITTRDEQVLRAHKANFIHDVNLLSNEEAICLFSRHAFGREIPVHGYKELSGKVVQYAAGLPLTIKVLGSHLCGRSELEWVDAIERLKTIPLDKTLKRLELSYNGLENDEKEIFLNVVCILKGEMKEKAINILQGCGFNAQIGLRVLEQKSLITISNYGYMGFHDHIEEMGRNIVRRLHPNEPSRHSRLWIKEEIEDILVNGLGTVEIKYIKLVTELEPATIMNGLRKMKELRFLYVHNRSREWKVHEDGLCLPSALRCLVWYEDPFHSIHKTFRANKFANLEMGRCDISQVLEVRETKVLHNLRYLHLTHNNLKTFDLGITPRLETLYLAECLHFVELYMPTKCSNLKYLNLRKSKVSNLNLGMTPHLETLDLAECIHFVELHIPVTCSNLKVLNLSKSKVSNLNLGMTPYLETLDLAGCFNFVELYMPNKCSNLKVLNLSKTKVSNLNLGMIPYLKELNLGGCEYLQEIHTLVGCLKKLVYLNLSGCSRFEYFLIDKRNALPGLDSLAKLELVAKTVDICPLHHNSNFPKFQFKCIYLEDLPSSSGNLEKLLSFGLCACTNLELFFASISGLQNLRELILQDSITEVPKDLGKIQSLEKLTLQMEEIKHLPDSICMLTNLKYLDLKFCLHLEQLPNDLGRLVCLEKLDLSYCNSLRDIPKSMCKMKCLKHLHLSYCHKVEKLPEELGRLQCLGVLGIEFAGISRLPQSVYQLKGLLIIGSRIQLESYGFTSMAYTLESSSCTCQNWITYALIT